MGGLLFTIFVYTLGGVTFLPLCIIAVLIHAHFTFPYREDGDTTQPTQQLLRSGDDPEAIRSAASGLDEKFQTRGAQSNDVAAGYFAVCREYVPGGVNGKPPERTTPTGSTTISSPSPSVYQSMYRSIFDRKQTSSPIDNKGAARPQKKGGNIFYVVLRHSHLMLFDDEEQIEVRYVISLAHHNVSIYGGGEEMPDGELFIKRNALCLSRKTDAGEMTADGTASKPFFLFGENTSDKEDFYFAMLKNQERRPESTNNPPRPLQFEVKHIISLVQRLHSSEEHLQTRWINALIGRIFLGLYKTTDVENFVRAKITKKISRVKTPSFLSKIVLQKIDMGESAPFITNPRLKELTVDGDTVAEADLRYTGNFRIEIAATARIDLGARFKAREVNLVLAVVLKKIEGHVQLRIKPPPSNRLWYTFTSMPKVDLNIEPIVSSRQITYTLILRQIENRIKEVIAESVVLPFWDDSAFFSTEGKQWRGGVWVDDTTSHVPYDAEEAAAELGDVETVENIESETSIMGLNSVEKSMSNPALEASPPATAYARKTAKSVFNLGGSKATGSSSSVDTTKSMSSEAPKAIRVGSYASTASSPVLSTDNTSVDAVIPASPPEHSHAAAAMAAMAAKSSTQTPVGSPSQNSSLGAMEKPGSFSSVSTTESAPSSDHDETLRADHDLSEDLTPQASAEKRLSTAQSSLSDAYSASPASISSSSLKSKSSNATTTTEPRPLDSRTSTATSMSTDSGSPVSNNKRATLTAVANAAATAKKWGLDALAARRAAQAAAKEAAAKEARNLSEPMGRGKLIPGMSLPPPDQKTKTAPIPVPKRKPIPAPHIEEYRHNSQESLDKQPPVLPKRRSHSPVKTEEDGDGLFVVAAPESEPTTPMIDDKKASYMHPWVDDVEDVDAPGASKVHVPVSPALPESSARFGDSVTGRPDLPSRNKETENERPKTPPQLPKRRPGRPTRSMSSSPEEDTDQLPSWMAAQEEEARSKTMWVDEDAGNLHQ